MVKKHIAESNYYYARAADMMVKAQAAPTKAIRIAYLNLARTWARKAAALEDDRPQSLPDAGETPQVTLGEQKN